MDVHDDALHVLFFRKTQKSLWSARVDGVCGMELENPPPPSIRCGIDLGEASVGSARGVVPGDAGPAGRRGERTNFSGDQRETRRPDEVMRVRLLTMARRHTAPLA